MPVLQDLVTNYNSTVHGQTRLPPNEVQTLTEGPVFEHLQELQSNKAKTIQKPPLFQVGDTVRILMKSTPYYRENTLLKPPTVWTKELYRITRVMPKNRYLLSDNSSYSGFELQRIDSIETLPVQRISTATKRKREYILPQTTLLEERSRSKRQRKAPTYLEDYEH